MMPKWIVSVYYGSAAKPPREEGGLAIEVTWTSPGLAEVEASAARDREDIGLVSITAPDFTFREWRRDGAGEWVLGTGTMAPRR